MIEDIDTPCALPVCNTKLVQSTVMLMQSSCKIPNGATSTAAHLYEVNSFLILDLIKSCQINPRWLVSLKK